VAHAFSTVYSKEASIARRWPERRGRYREDTGMPPARRGQPRRDAAGRAWISMIARSSGREVRLGVRTVQWPALPGAVGQQAMVLER